MRKHEIESWALTVIERVRAGATNEDSRVELKREWISPEKAARRIAAHANSALGEPILWVIGIDQKSGGLVQSPNDLASWWPSVKSLFDGVAPELIDVSITVDGKTVMALYFDTERRPFVVKSIPDYLEVPWREGTQTRSAKRNELIRLLTPVAELPQFEILSARFAIQQLQPHPNPVWQLKAELGIYVIPRREGRIVFPFHRAACTIQLDGQTISLPQIQLDVLVPQKVAEAGFGIVSATTQSSTSELIVTGPGSFSFRAGRGTNQLPTLSDKIVIQAKVAPAGGTATATMEAVLQKKPTTAGNEAMYEL